MNYLRFSCDVGRRLVAYKEFLPGRCIVESGEEVVQDAACKRGGLLEGDVSKTYSDNDRDYRVS